MAKLKLDHIYKVYPNGTKAVNDFTMDIDDGEFIVFVGPSGCGKSTTLRMIAGLEEISAGELYIGDTLVNDMEPKNRDVAMVFQNYALYPHMTVYENMAFGLTLRKLPRNEIHEKVMWAAEVLGLKEYLDRKPRAMSGGQRQRVSLGRAILRNPKVMLLDEPLSNLDAKLRSQMRSEISKLHQKLKTTFIYVTHDQVEAMTLGTRVVVMKLGRIQQIDTPKNLYDHPANIFVAGFIGTPQMNFFNVHLNKERGKVKVKFLDAEEPDLVCGLENVIKAKEEFFNTGRDIVMGIRCEDLSVEEADVAKGDNLINVTVSHFEELGNETLIYADLLEESAMFKESKTSVIIKAKSNHDFTPGQVVKVHVDVNKMHLFDKKTEKTILPRIPLDSVRPFEIKGGKLSLLGKEIDKPSAITVDKLKGNAIIPTEAIIVGKGEYEAKVARIEKVDKQHLAYLQVGDDLLFVPVDDKVKEGSTIKFSIKLDRVSFTNDKQEVIIEPLIKRDPVGATFVNLKTAQAGENGAEFVKIQEARIAEVQAKYAELEADLEEKRAQEIAAIDQSSLETKRVENEQAIAKLKQDIAEKLVIVKNTYKEAMAVANAKHKARVSEIKAAVKQEYDEMLAKEKADYQESLAINKDRDSRAARKQAYELFKETLPATREKDLNDRLNSEAFDYDSEKSAATSVYTRDKFNLTSTLKEETKRLHEEAHPIETVESKYKALRSDLAKEKEAALLHANLLFFFNYDGVYQQIPDDITNKIIQGLGSKVFTKAFRIEVPHNAFIYAENGLEAEVIEELDYVSSSFLKCKLSLYGQEVIVHVEKDAKDTHKVGDTVHLLLDIAKVRIIEKSQNIRLY